MASKDAILRLVVQLSNQTGLGWQNIVAQAQTAGRNAAQAMSSAMNSAGGVGGTPYGPANMDPFAGLRVTVQKTRQELETFYNDTAAKMNRTLGKDVPAAAQLATNDLARFYSRLNDVNVQIPQTHDHLANLNKYFALQNLAQAAGYLKTFGEYLAKFVNEGMKDSADKEAAMVNVIQGMLTNNPEVLQYGREAGQMIGTELLEGFNSRFDAKSWEKAFNTKAIELGLKTTFSDNQIAQGFAVLAQSGVDARDILDGVGDSMAYLAMIGKTDVPAAAKHMVSIYNQYGAQLKSQFGGDVSAAFTYVTDVVANSMRTSGVSLNEFINSLSYAGTVSSLAGQTFGDTAATLALFGRNGLYGSKAGTGLRRLITNLTPNTEKASEAMQRMVSSLGVSEDVFYDAERRMKSLTEVQRIMFDAMSDKSPQEQIYLLKTIFGQYAIAQALTFANAEGFQELADKINQTGTAQRQVSAIMDSSAGIQDRMTEAINTFKETIGETNLGYLNPLKKNLADLIENYLTKAPQSTQDFVATLIGGGAVLFTFAGGALETAANIGIMAASLSMAGISLGAVAVTVGWVLAAVVALAAAAYGLYKAYETNFGGFRDVVDSTVASVKETFSGLMTTIRTWISENSENFDAYMQYVKFVWSAIGTVISLAINAIVAVIGNFVESAMRIFGGLFEVIAGIFSMFMSAFRGDWQGFLDGLATVGRGVLDIIAGLFQASFGQIWTIFDTTMNGILSRWGVSWDDVKTRFSEWFTGFLAFFQGVWDDVVSVFKIVIALLTGNWSGALDEIRNVTQNRKDGILAKVLDITAGIGGFFVGLANDARQWATNMIDNFVDTIKAKVASVREAVAGVAGTVASFLGVHSPTETGPMSDLHRWMPNMMSEFTKGIDAYRPLLRASVEGAAFDISAGFGGGAGYAVAPATGGRSISITIENYAPMNERNAQTLADKLRDTLGTV